MGWIAHARRRASLAMGTTMPISRDIRSDPLSNHHPVFAVKNAIYVAVMQIWVIVMGVLFGALDVKILNGLLMPPALGFLMNYFILFLAVPPTWITLAMLIRQRPNLSDEIKNLFFWCGVLVLVALVLFMGYTDLTPWLHGMWTMAENGE